MIFCSKVAKFGKIYHIKDAPQQKKKNLFATTEDMSQQKKYFFRN